MTITFRGGRLPAQHARPHLRLGDFLTGETVPAPPPSADWLGRVATWPMYGNDQIGDCTFASAGHIIEALTTYAQATTFEVTDADVLHGYEAVSGYRPGQPSTDTGCVLEDVLAYWRKTGIGGHKILAYAKVDVSNRVEVEQAIALFGAIKLGINLPQSAEDQFNAGQPWDYVRGSRILGGHCVPVGRYQADGTIDGVTWAQVQSMTPAFWQHYVEEGWVVITQDWLDANGHSPTGLDLYGLGEALAALTGGPNPFPQPTPPAPTPQPVPAPPVPVPPTPTGGFAAALRIFIKAARTFIAHAEAWLAGKEV
jgi:hypothetical protein